MEDLENRLNKLEEFHEMYAHKLIVHLMAECCRINGDIHSVKTSCEDHDRERIEKLEKIVFADRDDNISLPDVHIPDDLPEYILTKPKDDRSEDIRFLDNVLEQLTNLKDSASLLNIELNSIEQMEHLQDPESDEISICTVNTDAAQDLIDTNPDVIVMPDCSNCKACLKTKAKSIKKEKKAKEKERRAYLKQLKINEREVLIIEQKELQNKLTSFRSQIDKISDLSEKQKIDLEKNI